MRADETTSADRLPPQDRAAEVGVIGAVLRDPAALDDVLAVVAPGDFYFDGYAKALRAALIGHGRATAGSVEAELGRLLESDNAAPKVSLAARPGLATVAELIDAGAVASTTSPVGAVLPEGDPGMVPAIREGRAAVQDDGSQLVALAIAAAEVSQKYDKPVLTATELAVAIPDNPGPATVRQTGRLCYAASNRAVVALDHLWRYARWRERRSL